MNDEQLVNKGAEQIKQVADKLKDLNPLKIAANLLNPFKRKKKITLKMLFQTQKTEVL